MLINYGKKILLMLIMTTMILVAYPTRDKYVYADYSENSNRQVDIVIRAGEWGNENQAKPGKRYNWGGDINISQHGISAKDIPTDIPLRCENNQWFISEFDINLKLAKAIAKKLDSKYGVDVNLQYATTKNQDLNAAGRIAANCKPKIYLSVHHNAYKEDTTGYFFMCNENDYDSAVVAKKLSNSISNNGMVPQRDNRHNTGYIGELNEVGKSDTKICVLGEFGYFNKAEIKTIVSDEYVDYVSDKIAESLYNQLKEIKEKEVQQAKTKTTKDVINIARDNYRKTEKQKEVVIRITEDSSVIENVKNDDNVIVSFK
jgi:N-acetylmuramoyl-L-alanine amidase